MSLDLLRREVRLRLGRRSPAAVALGWAAAGLALGVVALAAGPLVATAAGGPRDGLPAALVLRAAAVVFVAPCLVLSALAAERAAGPELLYLSRWRSPELLLAKCALPALGVLSIVVLSGVPLWLRAWRAGAIPPAALARAELVLLAFALAALGLGLLCSALFRDLSAAAAVALPAVALAVAAPLACGPLIERRADAGALIQASLRVSPPVAVAAALDLDILRTELLYRLSPIGQRRFGYPSPAGAAASAAGFAVVAFVAASWRFAAARRRCGGT